MMEGLGLGLLTAFLLGLFLGVPLTEFLWWLEWKMLGEEETEVEKWI